MMRPMTQQKSWPWTGRSKEYITGLFIGFASFVWFLAPTLFFCSASFVPLSSFVAFFLDQHCHYRSIMNDEKKEEKLAVHSFNDFLLSITKIFLFDLAKFIHGTTAVDDTWKDIPRGQFSLVEDISNYLEIEIYWLQSRCISISHWSRRN